MADPSIDYSLLVCQKLYEAGRRRPCAVGASAGKLCALFDSLELMMRGALPDFAVVYG